MFRDWQVFNMAILDDVKAYLDITWEDQPTNNKLTGIIERGKAYLNDISGATLNYDVEDKPRALLFDYCRYARSNALEMFPVNFKSELISLRLSTLTKDVGIDET